jgi:putative hydrolase
MGDDAGDNNPFPFGGMPFFADLAKSLSAQGPLNWDIATQTAAMAAAGDTPDPQPDPTVRFAFNSLADVADMHVRDVTGLPTGPHDSHSEIHTTTRALWAHRTLTDFRPLFTELATSLSQAPSSDDESVSTDPLSAMLNNLSSMMAPAMMGMSIGSMIGALAQKAFGQYDLPLARPLSSDILVVPSTIDAFANDWSLSSDDVRMWVLIHELSSHAILNTDAVANGITALVIQHVGAFRPDPGAIMDQLTGLDPSDPDALNKIQDIFGSPAAMLGAVRSSEQEHIAPLLDAHVTAIIAYIDFVVDKVCARVLGSSAHIAEAARRRRIELHEDTAMIEQLLGLSLNSAQLQRGRAFIQGVVERAGDTSVTQLVALADNLPTPNEIDAPGLWLARLEIQ